MSVLSEPIERFAITLPDYVFNFVENTFVNTIITKIMMTRNKIQSYIQRKKKSANKGVYYLLRHIFNTFKKSLR